MASDLGALLLFDPNNIRYVTSTHIGEWARDKSARCVCCRARATRAVGLRLGRAPPPAVRAVAARDELARRGDADARRDAGGDRRARRARRAIAARDAPSTALEGEPLGIDIPDMETLFRCSARAPRRRRAAGHALGARDQDRRRDRAARPRRRDRRRRLRARSTACCAPGVREHEIVADAQHLLFELGSEQVEAINAVSGDRCNPHPHVFSDRLLRPGDQAFFDIIHSFMGYRTCYYRTFNVGGVTPVPARRLQAVPRVARHGDRARRARA